jgi:small GTP-binding protein
METIAKVRPATVAIVGRPNVGKSALFNRLVGKRLAIVDDEPGVTRDRLYALVEWRNRTFSVIDTAGIDPDAISSDEMARQTRAQAEIAANDADVIVFVVDGKAGLSPLDDDVVHIMRKTRRPVVLCASRSSSRRCMAKVRAICSTRSSKSSPTTSSKRSTIPSSHSRSSAVPTSGNRRCSMPCSVKNVPS